MKTPEQVLNQWAMDQVIFDGEAKKGQGLKFFTREQITLLAYAIQRCLPNITIQKGPNSFLGDKFAHMVVNWDKAKDLHGYLQFEGRLGEISPLTLTRVMGIQELVDVLIRGKKLPAMPPVPEKKAPEPEPKQEPTDEKK